MSATARRGPQGPQGPAGPAGSNPFVFVQSTPATLWGPIVHGLGRDPAAATIYDTNGTQVWGEVEVVVPGVSIQARFSAPFGGKVVLP